MDNIRKMCGSLTKFCKYLRKDNHGLLQIIYVAVYLGIAVAAGAIVLNVADTIETQTPLSGAAATATGTFTFSGNVSNGELVNITNGAAIYRFEFNTTGNGSNTNGVLTANAIRINLSMEADWANVRNTSVLASGNLTAAINANASTAALVTAVNTTNVTTLTATSSGSAGNLNALSENAANIVASGANMTGGSDQTTANANLSAARNSLLGTAQTGYSFLPIVAVAAIGSIAIGFVFGLIPGLGGRKNEGGGGI